ncbi:sulfite exporter TauE/SafE family protein [Fructobacillus ficulneus]|uniref:Probable membrane transporter protein n=1 Tax=Fructobacillus ficulneus TaxID=157463 RepID=A0A0K8MIH5_9LACO|nr:TSUP family transporter [Fructobacillus ficulneus]GAP00372.1 hypothetical protein FFIC_283890 [Fructobacillus ficulneus]
MVGELIIIVPLVALAGFVDAIAGGGGLISLPAYLLSGLPTHYAVATNKLSSSLGTTVAATGFLKNGDVKWRLALPSMILAVLGSTIGSKLALILPSKDFTIFLLVVIPLTGLYLLFNKGALIGTEDSDQPVKRRTLALVSLIAFIMGIYDGFYGPGTGTFLLLLSVGLAKLSLDTAAANSKMINLTTNITALLIFLISGKVLVTIGLIAGAFSIVGNYLGMVYYRHYGSAIARPIILVVLAIFMVKMLISL